MSVKKCKLAFSSIWLLLLLALALRIPFLNGSFWLDEAAQALESARPFSEQLDIIPDFQPPLLHLILHFVMRLGRAEWWLRLIGALIPGLVSVWAAYKIGHQLKHKTAGLLASLLLATSSFHIFYSQELRPYSLAVMWALLSWLFLIRIWQQPNSNDQSKQIFKSNWVNYLLVTILGLYSTYLYPFLVLSQLIITGLKFRSKLKHHLLMLGVAALAFLPWLPSFYQQLNTGQSWRQIMPGWERVVSLPQLQAPALTWGKFVFGIMNLEISWQFVGLSLLIFGLALYLLINLQQNKSSVENKTWFNNWLLVTLGGCLPFLLAWLISFWIPVVRPKRLLFIQPLMYLSLTILITQAWRQSRQLLRYLAALLLIILISLNIFSTYQYYTQPQYQREDWRGLHQLISARFPDRETLILMSFNEPFSAWRWYNQGKFATLTTGSLNINSVDNLQQQLQPIYNYDFVLVFDYLRDLTDPDDKLLDVVESYGFKQHDVIDFANIGFVRIYIKDPQNITG
jgi:uncharacterized membrane protein